MRLRSTLPRFLPSFAKLGLDTLSTSVRVFFSPFFLSFKSFGVFGGWSLTALLKRHKARARESPRERERREFLRKKRRRKKSNDRRGIDVVIECDVE